MIKIIKELKELKELKESLMINNNNKEIYHLLRRICCKSDDKNNTHLYKVLNELLEVVTDDDLKYYLNKEVSDTCRLYWITHDITFSDSIYKVNGYGNLENINKSDFEDVIDDLIKELEY